MSKKVNIYFLNGGFFKVFMSVTVSFFLFLRNVRIVLSILTLHDDSYNSYVQFRKCSNSIVDFLVNKMSKR